MSQSKHTPGPWMAVLDIERKYFQIETGMHAICTNSSCYEPFNEGNARLIASAPELLEALIGLISEYDEERQTIDASPNAGCIECTAGTVPNNLNTGLCHMHKAIAAISKAGGKS